jgi:hypothetical protein
MDIHDAPGFRGVRDLTIPRAKRGVKDGGIDSTGRAIPIVAVGGKTR